MQTSSTYDIGSIDGKDSMCHLGHLAWQKKINSLLEGSVNNKITGFFHRIKNLEYFNVRCNKTELCSKYPSNFI